MKTVFLKRRALILAGVAILIPTSYALIDADGDGMSDVWEQQHGFATSGSQPANQLPSADPDKDGWTNLEESQAGTDPNSGTPPGGMIRPSAAQHPDFPSAFIVTWPTKIGKQYTLFASPDLATGSWVQVDEPLMGTGQTVEYGVEPLNEDETQPERFFWKVVISDVDSDSDTLSDFEEVALGYNPSHSDTDLDGLPDNTDPLPLVNAATASPDSAGLLGTTLTTNMTGRWDFENYDTDTTPPTGYTPWSFPDQTTGGRSAASFLGGSHIHQEGMVSKATNHAGGFVTIPPSLLNGDTSYSISFWAALNEGSVENSNGQVQGLFTHHNYLPHITNGSPNWGLVTAKSFGVWVQKLNNREILRAGYLTYTNDDGTGHVLNPPSTVASGVVLDRNLGTIDDGQWHHYVLIKSGASTTFYIDGVKYGPVSHTQDAIPANSYTGISLGRVYGPSPDSIPVQPGNQTVARGRFDRLRAWSDNLTTTEIDQLYHEDIDHDGLWDITENKTALWRDANSDEIRTSNEVSYTVSPFLADPANADHDRDGIPSIEEQTLGTGIFDADSDDDGVPDGYDRTYGAGVLVADTNLNSDADGDGLTLRQELSYGTNPNKKDTDGDLVNDNVEVVQGSRPTDATDKTAPPDGYSLRLAIGDESGSDSENYHMVVNRYDPVTRSETEIYRLQSGGYGQYSGLQTASVFRKGEEYTFRIQWLGTRNSTASSGPSEGPDYDYTMKIEEVVPDPRLAFIDAFDVEAGIAESGYQLLGEHNDVQNFQTIADTMAVKAEATFIDLAVDTNMNGKIESLPDTLTPVQGWPDNDRQLDDADPPRPVVIDVNNNNSDSGVAGSATSGEVDNANARLDTEADRTEMTSTKEGHSFGALRVFVWPIEKVKNNALSLKLSFADPAQADIIRVFDWQNFDEGEHHPLELLGPGKTSCTLSPSSFFGGNFNPSKDKKTSFRTLTMEGLTYGTATLKLELLNGSTEEVIATDEVRITVNVDRVAQPPNLVAVKKDARPLRGVFPDHIGVRKTGLSIPDTPDSGIRAVKGSFTLKIPSRQSASERAQTALTPMTRFPLRSTKDNTVDQSSGASFWIGLKERDSQGDLRQWVQTGVRWVQPPGLRYGSVPAVYLETGDVFHSSKSLAQEINGVAQDGQLLGGGVTIRSNRALQNWTSDTIRYSFVLFKDMTAKNDAGEDSSVTPWVLVVRDDRTTPATNESFAHMSLSTPNPPSSVGDADRDELIRRYRSQMFRDLDMLFETNQSITFAPGNPEHHASIKDVRIANQYNGSPGESPNPAANNGKMQLYEWALTAFNWTALPTSEGDLSREVKTGRSLPSGKAEDGTAQHPDWNVAPVPNGFELWDNRPYVSQP